MSTHLLPETLCQGCHLLQRHFPAPLCPGDLVPCWSMLPGKQGSRQQSSPQQGQQEQPQQGVRQQQHLQHHGACVDVSAASSKSLGIYLSATLLEHPPTSGPQGEESGPGCGRSQNPPSWFLPPPGFPGFKEPVPRGIQCKRLWQRQACRWTVDQALLTPPSLPPPSPHPSDPSTIV